MGLSFVLFVSRQVFDDGCNPREQTGTFGLTKTLGGGGGAQCGGHLRDDLGCVLYASNVLGSRGPRKMQVMVVKTASKKTYRHDMETSDTFLSRRGGEIKAENFHPSRAGRTSAVSCPYRRCPCGKSCAGGFQAGCWGCGARKGGAEISKKNERNILDAAGARLFFVERASTLKTEFRSATSPRRRA